LSFCATHSSLQAISPVFERLARENPGVRFYKVDVDAHPEISNKARVRAMPTFLAFKEGKRYKDDVKGAIPNKLEVNITC
jgi:thioredoxin 1